jgi:hypothetical protein
MDKQHYLRQVKVPRLAEGLVGLSHTTPEDRELGLHVDLGLGQCEILCAWACRPGLPVNSSSCVPCAPEVAAL